MEELPTPGSFDAAEVESVARRVGGEALLTVAVYDPKRYAVLWINEEAEGGFGDIDELFDVGDEVHGYLSIDRVQQQLFDDIHPAFGQVQAFTTYTEHVTMVRVVDADENAGVFVALERGADPTPLVDQLLPVVTGAD